MMRSSKVGYNVTGVTVERSANVGCDTVAGDVDEEGRSAEVGCDVVADDGDTDDRSAGCVIVSGNVDG